MVTTRRQSRNAEEGIEDIPVKVKKQTPKKRKSVLNDTEDSSATLADQPKKRGRKSNAERQLLKDQESVLENSGEPMETEKEEFATDNQVVDTPVVEDVSDSNVKIIENVVPEVTEVSGQEISDSVDSTLVVEEVISDTKESSTEKEVLANNLSTSAVTLVEEVVSATTDDVKQPLSTRLGPVATVVVDIEGTTTPISFVHDVLFPYVLANVEQFLVDNWEVVECQEHVKSLYELSVKDLEEKLEGAVEILQVGNAATKESAIESVVKSVKWQMSVDRKVGPLKALQGYMWKTAYENKTIKGVVYDDVVEAFKAWKSNGKSVYIYSSGSVGAQKLLFEHSDQGNLLEYIDGHFDTAIGPKVAQSSYEAIAKEIGADSKSILFLSDAIKECQAATAAGFQTLNVKRPGNAEVTDLGDIEQIETFSDLCNL
ncbi:HAD-like domain-containing protein [Globomyces pollinis-pini]|nr:HAD-like domain-containing protein [Globomyces pollinis-pini]